MLNLQPGLSLINNMAKKNKSGILVYLGLFIAGVLFIPLIQSCGKEGASITTANAQLNIVNASPDILPVNLYLNFVMQSATYSYPNASGYFLINVADTPLVFRPAQTNNNVNVTTNLLFLGRTLKKNVRYTWFITGLRADNSLAPVLTTDTGKIPAAGRGKIRFVNVSPNSTGLNLTANDTVAFTNITYKGISSYIEVTAGRYNFNISSAANPATTLTSLRSVTILDGKLYTIYSYGLVGRADTAGFNAGVVLNTIPDKFN